MGKLLKGIGNKEEIKNFYDAWSNEYDKTCLLYTSPSPRD